MQHKKVVCGNNVTNLYIHTNLNLKLLQNFKQSTRVATYINPSMNIITNQMYFTFSATYKFNMNSSSTQLES